MSQLVFIENDIDRDYFIFRGIIFKHPDTQLANELLSVLKWANITFRTVFLSTFFFVLVLWRNYQKIFLQFLPMLHGEVQWFNFSIPTLENALLPHLYEVVESCYLM